jgi:hypothetical protein
MGKTEKSQIQALNWFLLFLRTDIESMEPLDFTKLVVEAIHYFQGPGLITTFGTFGTTPKGWPKHIPDPEEYDPFGDIQRTEWKPALLKIQADLTAHLQEWTDAPDMRSKEIEKINVQFGSLKGKWHVRFFVPGFFLFGQEKDETITQRMARLALCFALHGLPRDALKKCQECGAHFAHVSAKPKYYCNPKCTTKALSRKRREADPEGYRRKQREIMRKVYRKRQAKKLGVPPDKVKIQKKSPSKGRKGGGDGKK